MADQSEQMTHESAISGFSLPCCCEALFRDNQRLQQEVAVLRSEGIMLRAALTALAQGSDGKISLSQHEPELTVLEDEREVRVRFQKGQRLSVKFSEGLQVLEVSPSSPLAKSLKAGDEIMVCNNERVNSTKGLQKVLAEHVEEELTLIIRTGHGTAQVKKGLLQRSRSRSKSAHARGRSQQKPQGPAAMHTTCPAAHVMKTVQHPLAGTCDRCGSKVKAREVITECSVCDYWVCGTCQGW